MHCVVIADFESEEILSYEEVTLYFPQEDKKRPVVLIGPQNIGRHELRQRLMESDISKYAAAIPRKCSLLKVSIISQTIIFFIK